MSQETITLHHVPQSRSMRVLWLLHELGVPFDVVVRPFDKSLRNPEFLSLSPAGRKAVTRATKAWEAAQGELYSSLGRNSYRKLMKELSDVEDVMTAMEA